MAERSNGTNGRGNDKTGDDKPGETLRVALLIDESGSMAPMQPAVVAGVNEFIAELKADENKDVRVLASLAMFDLHGGEPPVRVKFTGTRLHRVRPIGFDDYAPVA